MEILVDICKKQDRLLSDIQAIKLELSEIKKKNEHLEKTFQDGNKKPITLDYEGLSKNIWSKLAPLVKTENSVPQEIQKASTEAVNIFRRIISNSTEELNKTILTIPRRIIFSNFFYGFTDRRTFFWTCGFFVFVLSFCSAIFLFYYDTIKSAENVLEQNEIMLENIRDFRSKNPSLGAKYFPQKP